ncbi:putative motility protein [Parapusillimonas sp. JC17]|uniref:putative motility protein n=1 Tax=Parapusillimonas sp. JC17 TaxID=3445768 RepID=UPI003FA0ECC0
MSMSIDATVSTALAIETANAQQQQQMTVLRKTLDMQADAITNLVESAVPRLATVGNVGTILHTTA